MRRRATWARRVPAEQPAQARLALARPEQVWLAQAWLVPVLVGN